MVVAGTLTDKMAPVLKRLYDQMPDPKYVISMGSCANCGGPHRGSYSVTQGVGQGVPLAGFVPRRPPPPPAPLEGILLLHERPQDGEMADRRRGGAVCVCLSPCG